MKTVAKIIGLLAVVASAGASYGQSFASSRLSPNLVSNIDRPLRYRPDGEDFVITNGSEAFNRPLYGGNTAFRVDGGDRPEFVLYLPGRGGNLRFALSTSRATKWLHDAAQIETRYRPGTLRYEIRDPLLGREGLLRLTAIADDEVEGLLVQISASGIDAGVELVWAFGGVNGQRGKRDGDIGTESVPISEWFQFKPEFCRDNQLEVSAGRFIVRAKPATIAGCAPENAELRVVDAAAWSDPATLLTLQNFAAPALAIVVGHVPLEAGRPLFLGLQRIAANAAMTEDLATYREVTAERPANEPKPIVPTAATLYRAAELPAKFAAAEQHFATLRGRVAVDTPDAFLNAAVGALNVAADAVWDAPQQAIMHGAIAWRTRLLGWRGPYSLDALGWHDRARQHFLYWAGRQNVKPVPEELPPADEKANLARNETGLHSNGDLSNSHYDMNLVFIDALFRHLAWTGDRALAKELWPVIERHLAWERRLFRREFGPDKLPLYEAYAAIWASDDLQYHGGGTMHASAYNFFHNQQAARVARWLDQDATPYEREAQLLARGMRELLWVNDDAEPRTGDARAGWFGEFKDLLGLQRVHRSAALWTFYHAMDSGVPTPREAWWMARQVDTQIPHLPVRGSGVPAGLHTLATTNWLPYDWSINNVVMSEAVHAALGFWQAERPEEAWRIMKGSLLAAMFMGISPGNVGSMSYLDVYRRESQRDFADGSGVLSRAIVEGLFGVKPDALAGELRITPSWPGEWSRAALRHPDVGIFFRRTSDTDVYLVEQRFSPPQSVRLRLRAPRDRVGSVTVNGVAVQWSPVEDAIGGPSIELSAAAAARHEIVVHWTGDGIAPHADAAEFSLVRQGQMRWRHAKASAVEATSENVARSPATSAPDWKGATLEPVALSAVFNDRVTQIFRNEYRAPRSPFVSLALPKQGLGGWAGGVNANAEIDDTGLRAAAAKAGGKIALPNGVVFATPAEAGARNVVFTSQWDNYPRDVRVPLAGHARRVFLLMAGSTNPMQSRIENGEVILTYRDNTFTRLALENPTTWWPIEEDYFIDDFQFRVDPARPLPTRVDLKTGAVRVLDWATFKGRGGRVPGGAATVLELPLDPAKELQSLTVRALSNEVVIGLMAATLAR